MNLPASGGARPAGNPGNEPGFNPFPGLRPFREDEEYLFFGRELQSDALVNKLAATHFLAVVGTSGSGKSSLVNCGLRPALHRGLMSGAGTVWRMASLRPGNAPLTELAQALAAPGLLFPALDAGEFSQAELVESTLRISKLGLIDIFTQARLPDRTNLLIVVDQFEELFRYRELTQAGGANDARVQEEATAFMNLLLEVPAHPELPIYVVLTMRSDFLGECAQFFGLPEAINRGQYLIPRMTREDRRLAIAGPIGVGGADIDPALLTRLVNDVGDNPDQLSQLQHAMNRTWARWSHERAAGADPAPLVCLEHYEAIGTVAHALNLHAEEAFACLPDAAARVLCEAVFRAITDHRVLGRGTRRPGRLDRLCAITEATAPDLIRVIDVFRDARFGFLMPPAGEPIEPGTVIDISHESLMRVWQRLQQWGDEEAQSARILRRIAKTAELHAAGQANLLRNPELQVAIDWRRMEKPNAAWAAQYHPNLAGAMALIDASQTAFELDKAVEAQRQANEARLQAQVSRTQRMRKLTVAATIALGLATGVFAYLYQRAADAQKLASVERREARDSEARALLAKAEAEDALERARHWARESAQVQGQLDRAIEADPRLARAIDASAAGQTLVYLQIPAGLPREPALALQKQLKAAGYQAPAIETVSAAPPRFELRYQRDEDQAAAQNLAEMIRSWGFQDLRVVKLRGLDSRSRVRQLEVWFAAAATPDAAILALLVKQLDGAGADERRSAVATLIRDYRNSKLAIGQILALYAPDRPQQLSGNGRVNALTFLAATNPDAWSRELVATGREVVSRVGEAGYGPDTRAALDRLTVALDAAGSARTTAR